MARTVVPSLPHHITQRGNRRQRTFFCPDDYLLYMALLAEWCDRCGVEVWAYCLMPNHAHLIAVPGSPDGLRRAIGESHRRYTTEINRREDSQSVRAHESTGRPLGSDAFVDDLERALGRILKRRPPGPAPRGS